MGGSLNVLHRFLIIFYYSLRGHLTPFFSPKLRGKIGGSFPTGQFHRCLFRFFMILPSSPHRSWHLRCNISFLLFLYLFIFLRLPSCLVFPAFFFALFATVYLTRLAGFVLPFPHPISLNLLPLQQHPFLPCLTNNLGQFSLLNSL